MAVKSIILNRSTPMPPTDLKTQAKAAGLALYNIDTGGNIIGFLDSLGNPVEPKIYPLGGQPYPWDVAVGTKIMIDPATCLSGYGATTCPIQLISHGDVWAADGEQILYSAIGSYAAPVLTIAPGAAANTEVSFFTTGPSGNRPILPALFMYLGMGIRLQMTGYKDTDATASAFMCRVGTQDVVNSNNLAMQGFTGAVASQHMPLDRIIRITKLGAKGVARFTTKGAAKLFTPNTLAGDNNAGDYTSNFSTMEDLYVFLIHRINNTTGGASLVDFSISLVP